MVDQISLRRRATIDDVATLAGVSRSAVSRTFTLGASVSVQTRGRVEQAARTLGYKPNALARGLTKQSNQLVAFVSGYQDNLYDAGYQDRVLEGLQADGLKILHVHIGSGRDVGRVLLEALDVPFSVAVVAGGSIDETSIAECVRMSTAVVLCSGEVELSAVDCINSDNAEGTCLAVEHLMARGCQHIAYIAGTPGMFATRERQEAFLNRMAQSARIPAGIESGYFTFDGGLVAARRLLVSNPRPDALLCANDAMALGALIAARDIAGLRVPEDVAIVGFDDVPQAAWPNFALTTVRNPMEAKALAICERVRQRIDHPDCADARLRFQTSLIVRTTA